MEQVRHLTDELGQEHQGQTKQDRNPQDHGLRKRFNTILKLDNSVNHNVAKLMGHKNGLDGVYLTPTVDELFAEFRKVIHKIEVPNLQHAHGVDDKQIARRTSAGLA